MIVLQAVVLLSSCTATPEKAASTPVPGVQKAAASNAQVEQEIRQLDEEWRQAGLRADKIWFERHYADDLVGTDWNGMVFSKKDVLEQWDPGSRPESQVIDDIRLQLYGDVVVENSRATVKGKDKSGDYSGVYRATAVRVKRNGLWQVVAMQGAKVSQQK
ncbi:MAG TPA: nuclear transport factor 2 family protein [Blastocatellia bacterium]|nr:nuclear transport factor 2 family protein [Blastocatellia bacterium]